MNDSNDELATKRDLTRLSRDFASKLEHMAESFDAKLESTKNELRTEINEIKTDLVDHMESIKDQIIRAFQMTEENIRKDSVHVDEFSNLEKRVTVLENRVA